MGLMFPTPTAASAPSRWRRLFAPRERLALVVALVLAADLVIRLDNIATRASHGVVIWLVSAALSLTFARAAVPATTALRARSPRLAAFAVALASAAWVVAALVSLAYATRYGSLPVDSVVAYLVDNPGSALTLALANPLGKPVALGLAGATVALATLWWRAATPPATPLRGSPRWPVAVAGAVFVALLAVPEWSRHSTPEVHAATQLLQIARLRALGHGQKLTEPFRDAVAPLQPLADASDRPDVLFILHESVAEDAVGGPRGRPDATPRLDAFLRDHDAAVVRFWNAQSNAGSTLVSVVTMLTGLGPHRSAGDVHRAPLLWHYLRAAGYRTAFVTAQSLSWGHFDRFLLPGGPDTVWSADTSGLPLVNDVGVDDAKAVDEVATALAPRPDDPRPVFVMVQFNATHAPFDWHPGHAHTWQALRPFDDPAYLDALRFLDAEVADLLEGLDRRGALARTLVVSTADHGQGMSGRRTKFRLENPFDEVQRVPLWLLMPTALSAPAQSRLSRLAATARSQVDARVSNLDLLPTMLDAVGVLDALAPRHRDGLDGASLLRTLPAGRVVPFVNVTPWRHWSRVAVSLVDGAQKYTLFEDERGCHEALYDLAVDPAEQRDLWADASAALRARWLGRLACSPWLRAQREAVECPLHGTALQPASPGCGLVRP